MSRTDQELMINAAYRLAWKTFNTLPHTSAEDRMDGWRKLKTYIDALALGQTDPLKVATSALQLLKTFEYGNRTQATPEGVRVWA